MRHVVHKRVHLERPQPKARKRFGLLEKHKDYVKRARDFHNKQEELKRLHRRAYFRNQDEFAYAMTSHSQKLKDGKTVKKRKKVDSDELRLLESQDAQYVAWRELSDKRAVEKSRARLHFLDADRPNRHTLFIDDDELAKQAEGASTSTAGMASRMPRLDDYDLAKHFDTHPALLGRKANRPRISQLKTSAAFVASKEQEQETQREYKTLFARQERSKKLGMVRQKLELRKDLRSKGKRVKVKDEDGDKPAVFKWMPKRKR